MRGREYTKLFSECRASKNKEEEAAPELIKEVRFLRF